MSNSPLLGYNNNIPYKGRVYHVQTEDSGSKRPHVITHLFADGGRIVNTTKTSYADFVEAENMAEKVRALMREQHRAMVVSLRDGEFDDIIEPSSPGRSSPGRSSPGQSSPGQSSPGQSSPGRSSDPGADDVPLARDSQPSQPEIEGLQPAARQDGAYKKIVGRASPAGQGAASARKRGQPPPPPPRARLRSSPGRAGGALFGHAVRAHRSVPPGPPVFEMHDDPFGQRFTTDRSLDEVVSTFFEGG